MPGVSPTGNKLLSTEHLGNLNGDTSQREKTDSVKRSLSGSGSSGSGTRGIGPGNGEEFREKADHYLKQGLKFALAPISLISCLSSVANWCLINVSKSENSLLDFVASTTNRMAYFLNGIFGTVSNALDKNLTGAVGYCTVALASIFGDHENLYQLKGFGSALDQLPSMLQDVAHNPEIKKIYNIKDGEEQKFNKYSGFWDSVVKTGVACKVVCQDIYKEFMQKKSKGILPAIQEIFMKGNRSAEKNLVLSSMGIFLGSTLGIGFGLKKLGSSIRDISGAYADLALFNKGISRSKDGKPTGSNYKYMICGAMYELGSIIDLIYRWTGIEKTDQLAVGIDNGGFLAMNWANLDDIENNKKFNEANGDSSETVQRRPSQIEPVLV